ncbi:hypothetical protein FRC17_011265 [Serendipita sp. 399]|nr:hypothetical protein FRC17_011265 [Serendipita sp. 399]
MTIPGTGIRLNTQEAIDAWIAERKKNWPTDARIAEKKRRAAEAIESGEIERRHKRPRATEDPIIPFQTKRGKNTQRGGRYARRGRGGGRTTVDVLPPKPVTSHIAEPRTASPKREKRLDLSSNEDSSESGSGSDVDPIVDSISSKLPPKDWGQPSNEEDIAESELELPSNPKPLQRRKPREPTGRRLDPLIDRPSFLRRLLQHEIRTSVSNLSQAIRFIVANDMFAGVELRPGDADGALITEIGSTEATAGHETRT